MAVTLMPPRIRKLALTIHVTTSVGWLGAVASFLALAITGLASTSEATARGAYIASEVITWTVIVPLSFASLASGVVQALGTPWGLVRHYWILVKLALTVAGTALLLLHTQPIGQLGAAAAAATDLGGDLRPLQVQLVADAAAALAVLLGATVLSILKPRGMTRLRRKPVTNTTAAR